MATFSTNQVRHLYVATAKMSPPVLTSSATGTIAVQGMNGYTYFEYKGADTLVRSDLIENKNVIGVTITDADKMAQSLKSKLVTLDSAVNSGAPVAGQDYLLRIYIKQYIGMSDTDNYQKYGVVHAYTGMTASDFYKKLAISLAKNFSRELVPLLAFQLKTATTPVDVTAYTKESDLSGTYTGVILNEVSQEWTLGIKEQVPVYFFPVTDRITVSGDMVTWGTVTDQTAVGTIANGHKIADLEYFCMGDRGDVYRKIGFPNNFNTPYLVNSSLAYNVIDIHYAYVGGNEDVQKSEKTITIVVPKVGANNSVSNVLANSILTDINTKLGTSVSLLDVTVPG